ncbi:MAG: VOC family protein [Burkholderiales bacterium]
MKVSLLHVNIRCAAEDLPAIEKFYGEVLGMKSGYRPNFPFAGAWLYSGDEPLIHVGARFPKNQFAGEKHNATFDHVAFAATGVVPFREHLQKMGVKFEEQNVPNAGYQFFLHDPVGTKLEFNFPNEEDPNAVASGTVAKVMLEA